MSEPEKLFLIDMDAVKIDGLTGEVTHYSAEEMRAAKPDSERKDMSASQIRLPVTIDNR